MLFPWVKPLNIYTFHVDIESILHAKQSLKNTPSVIRRIWQHLVITIFESPMIAIENICKKSY